MIGKVALFTLCCFAVVYGHGTSHTSVSKPHEGDYKYGIDHHFHGHWTGASHSNGYGGLGDGHGSHHLGGAHAIGVLPQGGIGGYGGHGYSGLAGGYGGHGYNGLGGGYGGHGYNGLGGGYGGHGYNGLGGGYGGHGYNGLGGGYGGYGHAASSYANYNLHAGHGGRW